MRRIFPRALWACINEGRAPTADELAIVGNKVLHEAFRHEATSALHKAAIVARAALFGSQIVPPVSRHVQAITSN